MEPGQVLNSNKQTLDGEVWQPFPDQPAYLVSTLGRLRGINGRLLKQSEDSTGYLRVEVTLEDGTKRQVAAHRAVLQTFVGPRPDGMQAAHLDGNRFNNQLVNLKYVTAAENSAHKLVHGTATPEGENNPNARICDVAKTLMLALHLDCGMAGNRIAALSGLAPTVVQRILATAKLRRGAHLPARASNAPQPRS